MSFKKPNCLTLHEKSLVIQELNNGKSVTYSSKKYGVAKSTICKIKQKKDMISCAVKDTYLGPGKRRTLKSSAFPKMEEKLFDWFLEQRNKDFIVNGEMLKHKAKLIHLKINENNKKFTASDGWLQRFKKRFGIQFLKIRRKELHSRPEFVDPQKIQVKNELGELNIVITKQFFDPHETASGREIKKEQTTPTSAAETHNVSLSLCEDEFKNEVIENPSEQLNKISLDSVMDALNIVTQWAENNEVDVADLIVLNRLREKAAVQKIKKSETGKISDCVVKKDHDI